MWENEQDLPPGLIEALAALTDEGETFEGAVVFMMRPDPKEMLKRTFRQGLEEGHRFYDIFGSDLQTPDEILGALKADGRVHVTQTVVLDPGLVPYL